MLNNEEFLNNLLAEKLVFKNNYDCVVIDMHYNDLAENVPPTQLDFLNHGYLPSSEENLTIHGNPSRFKLRNSDFLLEHVIEGENLANKRILEVGSGRGGNCWYITQYFRPELMIGMDVNTKHVDRCTHLNQSPKLAFIQGDAQDIPFGTSAFDSVINIESSHMYSDLKSFFGEVKRVLRPNGSFYYSDIIATGTIDQRQQLLQSCGFKITRMRDITANVMASIEQRLATMRQNPTLDDHAIQFYIQVGELALAFFKREIRSFVSFQLHYILG